MIHPTGCPGGWMTWTLLDPGGNVVASNNACGEKQVNNLAGGTYRLDVTPYLDKTGSYSIDITVTNG
jgi:hypothetical protein